MRLACTSFRISPADRDAASEASSVDLFAPRDELELDDIATANVDSRKSTSYDEVKRCFCDQAKTCNRILVIVRFPYTIIILNTTIVDIST